MDWEWISPGGVRYRAAYIFSSIDDLNIDQVLTEQIVQIEMCTCMINDIRGWWVLPCWVFGWILP